MPQPERRDRRNRPSRKTTGKLSELFGIPPFSFFDSRSQWWQTRKAQWFATGIKGELGRGENGRAAPGGAGKTSVLYQIDAYSDDGIITSGFDPVLSEIIYRWFSPLGGLILDPFSGGSTRGIVASKCGRDYLGIDLRPEQIEANREQARRICGEPMPQWLVGDSSKLTDIAGSIDADFIFTSPPYAGLERYSEDKADLSTMGRDAFLAAYREIISAVVSRLKPNRFACFVVGDKREKDGSYTGLPWQTVEAFEAAGARLYNEAVLITPPGSVPIRMRKQFETSRKFGKTHQNVLFFVKGDAREAALAIGAPEFYLPSLQEDLFGAA